MELHRELEKKNTRSIKGKEEHKKLLSERKILKTGIQTYEEQIVNLNTTLTEKDNEIKDMLDKSKHGAYC